MTATPGTIADQPDVLSELLRALRLTGGVFMDGQFTTPFGIISPARWDAQDQMARLRHVSVFHLVAEGACRLETADGETCELSKGDIVLVPFTAAHKIWNGEPESFGFAPDHVHEGPINGVGSVSLGGGGDATRIVCGFLESAELMTAPLFRSLPPLLVERAEADPVSSLLTVTAAEILRQVESAAPGAPFVLGRLMELLFVEVVRRHAEKLPPTAVGVLAAMRDQTVAKAIWLLHQEPTRRWTIDDLAGEAGASRSVLTERFNQSVGKPPIEYLIGWRIQLACERLKSSRDPLARIAEAVGYESEAAFSRAFKREMGVSPGAWRAA
ncbi:MAG TPA: AraC family transcriptional regulator [Caulobacteraceae bacterium]|nr:AraC family transcriptional regulator [Caulobacteraceae bacterium]